MNEAELERYSRQILLPEIDLDGQRCLTSSSVLVVGAGGLGGPVALYLAAAGVGRLTIADGDTVELSNLQRQIAHTNADIGRPKARSAAEAAHNINPNTEVIPLSVHLRAEALVEQAERADVVVDCCDNFATRFDINAACVATDTPLVSAALSRWELQIAVFDGGSPCYRCLYDEGDDPAESCSSLGVIAPLPGVGGSLQAIETIKVLTGAGEPLYGRLLIADTLNMRMRVLKIIADPACPVCAHDRDLQG